jgi:hypothetical protein
MGTEHRKVLRFFCFVDEFIIYLGNYELTDEGTKALKLCKITHRTVGEIIKKLND